MSRTFKGSKPQGYEYWSRRPYSRHHGAAPGRLTKILTHRKERREALAELRSVCREEAEEFIDAGSSGRFWQWVKNRRNTDGTP